MTLNALTPDFLAALDAQLGPKALRPVDVRYLEEPRGRWAGQAGAVVAPASTAEVAIVLAAAAQARVGVVPYSGGTGLVGGQIMPDGAGALLLSLERMTAIRAVYPEENVLIAEAGAILEEVHRAAEAVERVYPLTIASKGSARVGGLLACNAGGVNVLRYGNARDLCLGLEVVFADGRIWNGLSRLRKDNTGYDLRNLLIGSEGTLGVITAASLKLVPRPAGEGTALLVVPSPEAALALLSMARDHMGEAVSAFELMSGEGLRFQAETMPDLRQPFEARPEWFVLIDVGLARGLDPAQALETLFAEAFEAGLVSDGIVAQNDAQRHQFWEVREQMPEANRRIGSVSSHDISVPLGLVPEFIRRADAHFGTMGDIRINCFGHLGDGNLHYNIFPAQGRSKAEYVTRRDEIKRAVHDISHDLGGSHSAEHGIGRLKVQDLITYGDPVKIAMMREIKRVLDPVGILNPGAVLG
ncbi:MAG TPA: hydroxyacid dehydrogenase [Rhodobacteraceae bacterium]|jgi:FAD/FMN-containing dehydrogenase|nr:hydroxyacid dehydrogenase [Paracoccaceae bacterium]